MAPSSQPSMRSAPVPGGRGRGSQLAWALVPLLTLGMLAFVPFVRLALARRRPVDWVVCGSYLAADIGTLVLVSVTKSDSTGATLAGGFALLLAGLGTVHTLVAFRPAGGGLAAPPADPNRLAVENAEKRMRRRQQARKLIKDNPVLAGELKIGRPDLRRSYDDGGLVDVNHVPATVLASQLGLAPAEVSAVIAARDRLGSFASAEELSVYAELPPGRIDGLRDWMLFG